VNRSKVTINDGLISNSDTNAGQRSWLHEPSWACDGFTQPLFMPTPTSPSPRDLATTSLPQVDASEDAATSGVTCRSYACCGGWFSGDLMSTMAMTMLIFVVACALHLLAVRWVTPADTAWFAITGVAFLIVTAGSHAVACRPSATAPLVPLMISMAIRLAGTFLILGIILNLSPLSRPEAVFNVLFWYITLTVADLLSVVRHKNRDNYVTSVIAGSVSTSDQA